MSLSLPSKSVRYKRRPDQYIKNWKDLHWTEQLALYPLSDRPVYDNAEGDRNNRLDNWEVDDGKDNDTQ